MTLRLANTARTAAADGIVDLLDAGAGAGTIKVYTGSQPATPDTAATGTLLVTFTLADPAFNAAVTGVVDIDADPDLSATAAATGTAGWFRAADSTGAAVFDGACGTVSAELNLTSVDIVSGGTVTVATGTITMPVG